MILWTRSKDGSFKLKLASELFNLYPLVGNFCLLSESETLRVNAKLRVNVPILPPGLRFTQ